jgi:hypothetical protein
MATINYEITYGTGPFTVSITPPVAADQHPAIPGVYFFTNIPDGDYIITISNGCNEISFVVSPMCATTTSTTTICDVLAELISVGDEDTTTTTSTTVIYPIVECLDGLVLEFIYLDALTDLTLLPVGYTHPCQSAITTHFCNRALYEVHGNGIYVGDSRMNNLDGTGGGSTSHSHNFICQDYYNYPSFYLGQVWTGSARARYDRLSITYPQAIAIANTNNGGTVIEFAFQSAMSTYNASCDAGLTPHMNITWVRISSPDGVELYSGCPEGVFLEIDVCTGAIPTTTTTSTTTLELETVFIYIPNIA